MQTIKLRGPTTSHCLKYARGLQTNTFQVIQRPISEKRKSRDGTRNMPADLELLNQEHQMSARRDPQVMTNSHLIYLLLLVQLASLATCSLATSHINSIWVSRDDLQQAQLDHWPSTDKRQGGLRASPSANNATKSLGKRRFDFVEASAGGHDNQRAGPLVAAPSVPRPVVEEAPRKGARSTPSTASLLQASGSSLQPAIASIEPEQNYYHNQVAAQRRSSAPHPSGPQFKLAHLNVNFSDEATSLDHLWSGGQTQSQRPQSRPSKQTSNAQVHFDEDQQLPPHLNHQEPELRRLQQIPKPLSDMDLDRRQDNETNVSNLAPRHEPAHRPIDEDQFYEQPVGLRNKSAGVQAGDRFVNSSDGDLDDSLMPNGRNSTVEHLQRNTSNERQLDRNKNFYYALTEHQPPVRGVFKEPTRSMQEQHPLGPPRDSALEMGNFSHLLNDLDSFYHSQAPLLDDGSQLANKMQGEVPQNQLYRPHPSSRPSPRPASLSYGFVPTASEYLSKAHQQHQDRFHPRPTGMPSQINFYDQFPHHQARFSTFSATQAPVSYSQQRRPTALPQSLHQMISSGHLAAPGGFAPPTPPLIRRSRPATSRLRGPTINLGEAPNNPLGGGGSSKLFLRNYIPMQLIGGGKSRKSLLSTINEKLNTWTGDSSGQSQDELRLLEGAFFDHTRERPPRINPMRAPLRPSMRPSRVHVRPLLAAPAANLGNYASGAFDSLDRPTFYEPIRQPTVAPASSVVNRFYGVGPANNKSNRPRPIGLIQHQGSQQPASFIPVVAVQVTRTSPAPNALATGVQPQLDSLGAGKLGDQMSAALPQDVGSQTAANELDEYLAAKTGHLMSQRNQANADERQKWDDSYGGTATTSQRMEVFSMPRHHANPNNAGRKPSPGQVQQPHHETTIKGAVFGYLPHQADAPLMQAMNMLQQLPATQQQFLAATSNSNNINYQQQLGQASASNELYANQMDKSSQAVDAATPFLDYQALAAAGQHLQSPAAVNDQQPSLALQLQAHNIVQNDIAHPFGALPSSSGTNQQRLSGHHAGIKPLDVVYPGEQLNQYPGLQYLTQGQFGVYQDQLPQFIANPLLGQTGQLSSGISSDPAPASQLLATGPNDLSLLASSPLFLQSGSQQLLSEQFFSPMNKFQGDSQQHAAPEEEQQQSDHSSHELSSSDSPGQQASDSVSSSSAPAPGTATTQRNQNSLDSKGKKRSSEFFANAGQLLLSALPLLLAPTLGLMFASSPYIPAARLHGVSQMSPASNGASGSFHQLGGGSQGSFGASADDGLVLNASPAQLFTPTPPGNGSNPLAGYPPEMFSAGLDAPPNKNPNRVELNNRSLSSTTTSTTTSKPRDQFKSSASLSALTGLRLATSHSTKPPRNSSTTSSTTSRPFAVVLTTFGPSAFIRLSSDRANFTNSGGGELAANSTNRSQTYAATSEGDQTTVITPTLLVVHQEDEVSLDAMSHAHGGAHQNDTRGGYHSNGTSNSQQSWGSATDSRHRNVTDSSTSTTTRSPHSNVMYDIGYEGADFDAQFPALRRSSTRRPPATTLAPELSKFVKDKSHYQYAEVVPGDPAASANSYEFATVASGHAHSSDTNASRFDSGHQLHGHNDDDQLPAGLFPLTTWPPLRRRTVSLITSNGNKTLPDSSERYLNRATQNSKRQKGGERRTSSNKLAIGQRATSSDSDLAEFAQDNLDRQPATVLQTPSAQFEVRPPTNQHPGDRAQYSISGGRQHLNGRRLSTLDSFVLDSSSDLAPESRGRAARSGRKKRDLSKQVGEEPGRTEVSEQQRQQGPISNQLPKSLRKIRKIKKVKKVRAKVGLEIHQDNSQATSLPPLNSSGEQQPLQENLKNESLLMPSEHRLRPQLANQSQAWSKNDESAPHEQTLDPLRRDSSRSKSAIVTAMITHVASGDQDREQLGPGGLDGEHDDETPLSHEELREQLVAKKMLLDRLATRTAAASDETSQPADEQSDNFQAGGRGRFKPAPIAGDFAPLQGLELQPQQANFSATRFVNNRGRLNLAASRSREALELNEDTKRALAKFGTLLLEDTLQIPAPRNDSSARSSLGRDRRRSLKKAKYANQQANAHEHYESSATERYPLRATTQMPLIGEAPVQDNWSRYYAERNLTGPSANYTRTAHEPIGQSDQAPLAYQYPPSRTRHQEMQYNGSGSNLGGHQELTHRGDSRYDSFEPNLRQQRQRQQASDYNGGGQAVAFRQSGSSKLSAPDESTINKYDNFLMSQQVGGNRTGGLETGSNSTSEQLDARHSTNSNYSTSAPTNYNEHSNAYGSYYDRHGPMGRRYETGPPPASHYPDDLGPPPPPPSRSYGHEQQPHYYGHIQNSSYGASTHPQRHPPAYHSSATPYQAHRQPVDDYETHGHYPPAYRATPVDARPPSAATPPTKYPAHMYEQPPGHHHSPAYNQDNYHHHHLPSGSTYAPPSSSLHGDGHFQAAPPHSRYDSATSAASPIRSADSTRAVNDYLKRVQFSDSDRDKLMASYLTCDGLLHDTDHCLERLSCEFSDPQNIEKANKLDRAVSSILLGHILINTYIPNSFKLRLKSASLFGYTQSGKCSKFACSKLASQQRASKIDSTTGAEETTRSSQNTER